MTNKLQSSEMGSNILLYQTEDGLQRIEVRLENETVWLSQKLMADLFQTTTANINIHLKNIFEEQELTADSVIKESLITAADGKQYQTKLYRLEAIIAVGYRVNSHRGTQFRKWATERLREYIVKGFTLDDERLKKAGGGSYFDELLARIRDIRSSEKVFWRKVLDIYATSVDYDPRAEVSQKFFAVVQNKMHWAAHGHTAAEIVHERANAGKPNMGMTSWSGKYPRTEDAEIAKNYLTEKELDALNRIVTAYLEFAEIQALNRNPMTMNDWVAKLDDFLKLSGRDILLHAGKVSHEMALEKARAEYEKYRAIHINDEWPVERHFLEATKKLAPPKKTVKKGKKGGNK